MIRLPVVIGLTGLLCVAAASGWAQDRIIETDVVTILNGKPRLSTSGHPVGIALHLPYTPMPSAKEGRQRAPNDDQLRADDLLYRTLIPLARALEAGAAHGSRYLLRLSPDAALPSSHSAKSGPQLLDAVARFLTTYFTIPPERLTLQLSLHPPTIEGQASPQSAAHHWRLDVLRED